MRTFFVELPVSEARNRWRQVAQETGRSLLPKGRDFVPEFIPAEGGCVIAMMPRPVLRGRPRLPIFRWVADRLKERVYDAELERVERLIRGF